VSRSAPDGVGLDDPAVLGLFDRELLSVHEDADQITVAGFRDGFSGLNKRVLAGEPLRTSE